MQQGSGQNLSREWSPGEIGAWAIILVSVTLLFVLPLIFKQKQVERERAASAEHPSVELLLVGRYLVGANAVLPMSRAGDSERFVNSMDHEIKTPWDQFRAAIVRGEIISSASALTTLDELAEKYPELQKDVDTVRPLYHGTGTPLESPDWKDFHDRHQWFADLAASYGKPSSDSLRHETISAGYRTVFTIFITVTAALLAFLAGVIVFIFAVIKFLQRNLTPTFSSTPAMPVDRSAYVEGFAWYIGGMLAFGIIIKYVLQLSAWWGSLALPFAFFIGVFWPIFRGQTWAEWRAATGFHTGKGFFREIGAGALGYLAAMPLLAVGFMITWIIIKLTGVEATHPIVEEVLKGGGHIFLLIVMACIWAPITEELMFRGALFAHLRERFGWALSAFSVAFLFAIIHPQGWAALPVLGTMAVVFAAIREWRGSTLACMTAHAINNTAVTVMLLLMVS